MMNSGSWRIARRAAAPLLTPIGVACALALTISVYAQSPTIFTYQGRLMHGADPASGVHVMEFSLWDAPAAGNLVAGPIVQPGVVVTDGLFTTQIDFGVNAFNNAARWLAIEVDGIGLTPRQFISRTPYSMTTRGLFVDGNMRAGIGTNQPSAETTLHVRDNTNDNFGVLVDSFGVNGSQIGLHSSTTTYASLAKNAYFDGGWTRFDNSKGAFLQEVDPMGNVRLNVATHGAGFIPWISSLYLQNDGRVGIGVSIPLSATLEIASPEQNADISLFSYNNTTDDRARIFLTTFERSWWIENDGFLNLFKIRDSTAGIDRLIIETDGSVGINTNAPGAFLLAVNGSAAKTGGGTWSVFSDARLKKNIRDLDGALKRLLRLRGRTFEFIDPEAHFGLPGQQIGLIAQEVENVFPEWIDEDEDGTRILTIRGFEALTIEALREMQADCDAMIQTQATRIASLERDNAALSQRLARLEQMLDSRMHR